jgi:GNAT superfamily N-acetyltransferase
MTSGDVTYRLATTLDLDQLVEMRCAFLHEAVPEEPMDPATADVIRQYFERSLANGLFTAFIAEADRRIVATSGMVIHHHPPTRRNPTGKIAYLMNMYTLPEFRRRGMATELLKRLIEAARAADCRRVCLHALVGTREFYGKCGFTPVKSEMRLEL